MSGSPNVSSSDHFAQFGKALSTTASALFGSQSMEDTILSYSSPYKKLLHQTITNSGSDTALMKMNGTERSFKRSKNSSFQDLYSATNGKSFFSNRFSNSKTSFQVLSYLSDDMLYDVPTGENKDPRNKKLLTENGEKSKKKKKSKHDNNEPSLFQGFEASLPVINETIDIQHRIIKNKDIKSIKENEEEEEGIGSLQANNENVQQEEFSLPQGVKLEKINSSYSVNFLKTISQDITNSLDLLEIQKNLAASEIREIDLKLEKLKMMRELVFKRVAKVEQNELFLERHLISVRDRIDMIQEYGLEQEEGEEGDDEEEADKSAHTKDHLSAHSDDDLTGQIGFTTAATTPVDLPSSNSTNSDSTKVGDKYDNKEEEEGEEAPALMSKSIYQKLQKNPPQSQASTLKRHQHSKKKQQQQEHPHYNHHNRHRKTYPTLQQYYEPGSKISSFAKAHEESITCLDFDMPFGTMCTAGKLDHTIKVWDLSKQKQTALMSGHLATISCMQMDQFNTLITGGRDALLKLWDVDRAVNLFDEENIPMEDSKEDACVYTFDAHVDEITALSFSGDNLISGSQDRTIRQWDLNSGKCVQTIDINFASRVNSSTSGTLSSSSSTLLVPNEQPVIGALQCYDAALATGTKDGLVRLWDLRSGQVVRTLQGHTDAITSLQFDSINLITGSIDRSIRIWDLRTGTLADAFAYENPVSHLEFDLDKIVVANNENTVKIYDRKQDEHWFCGGNNDGETNDSETVEFVKYKHGYMVEGNSNGDVHVWAI